MANNTNGNQFRDDEIIILEQLRDGKMGKNIFPKIGGRLRLAHEENDQLSITTEIIKYDESWSCGSPSVWSLLTQLGAGKTVQADAGFRCFECQVPVNIGRHANHKFSAILPAGNGFRDIFSMVL
jgi:hypothetical protein